MKINEVEQLLGISKANIRFYEKQNLLKPIRKNNGYREYTPADIECLKSIIIMRKLGISVQAIEKVLNNDLSFQDAVQANIAELEEQMEQLESALELSRQIACEQDETLDTQRYWTIIREKERQGAEFVDVAADYWLSILQPVVFRKFALSKGMSLKKMLLRIALICGIVALVKTYVWKEGNLLINFLYWPLILVLGAVITFPIYWLGKHRPKAAAILNTIMLMLCGIFLGAMVLYLVIGLVATLWNSIF